MFLLIIDCYIILLLYILYFIYFNHMCPKTALYMPINADGIDCKDKWM